MPNSLRASSSKRRILIIAEAVTLAHVARPLALARIFGGLGHEVMIASSEAARRWVEAEGHALRPIRCLSPTAFLAALHLGKPVFDAASLERDVEEDLALLSELRPDIVLGDFRLSLYVSCRLAGRPYGNITNAYWSPEHFRYAGVPDIPLSRALGAALADPIFRIAYRPAFAWHSRAYAHVARRFGLPPPPDGLLGAYTHSDFTAFADLAELYGADQGRAPRQTFIGPLLWAPQLPPFQAETQIGSPDRPLVYVSLGSSGSASVTSKVLTALGDLPLRVVATSGGAALGEVPSNATLLEFAPGDRMCELATVVVGNGGSPIAYQALAAGRPVLGLASNLDQFLNMRRVEAAGAGRLLRAREASPASIRAAVQALADDPAPRAAAERFRRIIAASPQPDSCQAWIEQLGQVAKVGAGARRPAE